MMSALKTSAMEATHLQANQVNLLTLDMHEYFVSHRVVSLSYNLPEDKNHLQISSYKF